MIYFIKKIFLEKVDDSVHFQFIKFSKGIFDNKAVMNISRNGKIKISGTYELANNLILFIASLTKSLKVSGLLLSKNEIKDLNGKKKSGLFNYQLDQEISSEKLNEISSQAYYMLFDCSAPGIEFKTKKKLPRPSNKSIDKVKDKFCVASLDLKFWPSVKDEFLFDMPEGKKYRMIHKYEIKEIILPKNEIDSEKMRLLAKKKGKLTRKVEIDGKEAVKETEFIA